VLRCLALVKQKRQVHQLLAALSYGDAVSNDALSLQGHLRAAGFASDIYAEHAHPRMTEACRPLWDYEHVSGPQTVCLYHFAIASAASRCIMDAPDRVVLRYHNITPARFFAPYMPHLARQVDEGRRQLALFAPRAELALGDSEFNRRELEKAGYRNTGVLPIFFEVPKAVSAPPPVIRRLFDDGRTNVLFVGRVICNKRIEDLLRVFAVYKRYLDPRSRLIVVGDTWGYEAYFLPLERMARELALPEVVFTGQVEDAELPAFYEAADVFLCLSEHEGFCVPLLEAMSHGVPVLAYDAGAVAETLRGGGVLLKDKRPEVVAELVHQVVTDEALRAAVLATQERTLREIQAMDYARVLQERLAPVLDAPAAARA
jgi:glycosyltransferase involved in cell wall biosynthesis